MALRRALVANASLRVFGWWVGMALAALAALFLLEGRWGAAGLCALASAGLLWAVGFWVAPRSPDAYLRRAMRAWQAWAADAQSAYDTFSDREARHRTRIERLRPPPGHEADHDRLLALLAEVGRTRSDRSAPNPERVRRGVAGARAITQAADTLCAAGKQAEQRQFCEGLMQARHARRAEYRVAAERAEHATEQVLAKLTALRPPAAAAAVHAQMLGGFRQYLEVLRRFHTACLDEAPDAAAREAAALDETLDALQAASRALRASIDDEARWPRRRRPGR